MAERDPSGLARNRATGAFERRVARALAALQPPRTPLVVACSGGPDSMAALVAVARARAGEGPVLAACFDHGLRPEEETRADRAAVAALAAHLSVRCVAGSARAEAAGALRSEAAGRAARYGWLARVTREAGASACVTGHTLDDQAETVLLRLTRGAGLAGAAGMAASAPWPVPHDAVGAGPALRVLRPLLERRRSEVEAYLEALGLERLGLAPRRDPSNEALTFDRNRIRHRVLPELRKLNPRVDELLAGFAARARSDDEALEAWAEREAERLVRVEACTARIQRRALRALPEAVATRLLRGAAAAVGLRLHASQTGQLLRIAGRRGARLSLAGGRAWVEGAELRLAAGGDPDGGGAPED